MKYFLGLDIGNTKSHALLADETGRAVGFGQAGPGSWEAIGWDGAQEVLCDLTNMVLDQAGISRADIWGAGFGYAGYDWPEDRPGHEKMIDSLALKNAAWVLGNDTLVGLVAGATAGWGVVVVAGTSNNCRGWDRDGREGRITGQGHQFGEYGGAGEIVARAIQAISLSWAKRGPETLLSDAFVEAAGARDIDDLFAGLVRNRYHLSASAAPLVFDVAAQGDEVARAIICWAGRELGSLAVGVIRQLSLEKEAFDVVLSGSLYKGSSTLEEEMRKTIHAIAPGARLVRLKAPPVIGGVLLGMDKAGLDTTALRQTLIQTTNELHSLEKSGIK
ncbi:MAG TPA: BadF/BadG/BcrA/BcrD ATPase family protein [Anaerolineae bacterium]|jgi:N-acetylglucosamine kinase-like BadF-type ATPase|nr:BadF/BadG/BcrA/BcrD ATPase family protein [Anaerolineae bacterium]